MMTEQAIQAPLKRTPPRTYVALEHVEKFLAFGRREAWGSSLKTLLAFMAAYLFNWFLLGSAIPWYAFIALAVLPVLAVYYLQHPAHHEL